MINLIEEAALSAIEHLLPDGKQSLGTQIDVSHVAATPVGMTVKAEAELLEVNGRKLLFAVRAHDEMDLIGEGRHERVVGTAASFQARIDEKCNELRNSARVGRRTDEASPTPALPPHPRPRNT